MIAQNTQEWREARAGKITASRMCDVMAFGKRDGKPLKARTDYIGDIIAELLTGEPREQVRAKPMDWGHDVEDAARAAYSAETGEVIEPGGFVICTSMPYVGCSPDGLVSTIGQIQIKCPQNPSNHIDAIRNGMPEEHIAQVQGELMVTGRDWSDFVSFDPRMPEHLRLFVQRVPRDEDYIARLREACASLWVEVQDGINYLGSIAA